MILEKNLRGLSIGLCKQIYGWPPNLSKESGVILPTQKNPHRVYVTFACLEY